jgi:chromosome segregation ATPase
MNDEPIALRDEMRQGFSEMRQEFATLRQEFTAFRLETRQEFATVREEMGQEFATVREETRQGLAELRRDVAELRLSVATLTRRVDGLEERVRVLDERVRANGVLLEALRDDVRQIAEAHVMLSRRVEDYRSESDAQRTMLSLLQTSYRDLDRRVTRLEARADDASPRPS